MDVEAVFRDAAIELDAGRSFAIYDEQLSLRLRVTLPREVEDLDIIQTGEHNYQIAYCYKYQIFTLNISKNSDSKPEPEQIWDMPEESPKPAFRSIRYISKDFILAAVNLPNRSGAVIHGYRLPAAGKPARMAVTARIPGKISATRGSSPSWRN